jgi:hypothetical protein
MVFGELISFQSARLKARLKPLHRNRLACAENELLASLLKDELRIVLRKHVRGATSSSASQPDDDDKAHEYLVPKRSVAIVPTCIRSAMFGYVLIAKDFPFSLRRPPLGWALGGRIPWSM